MVPVIIKYLYCLLASIFNVIVISMKNCLILKIEKKRKRCQQNSIRWSCTKSTTDRLERILRSYSSIPLFSNVQTETDLPLHLEKDSNPCLLIPSSDFSLQYAAYRNPIFEHSQYLSTKNYYLAHTKILKKLIC